MLEVANTPAYRDLSQKQIVPRLADEQQMYPGSEATLYRLLRQEGRLAHRERSRPATSTRPAEHVATGPDQIWSRDIERHEALLYRAVMKGHRSQPVAAGW